ncbi:MAG: hypothetical protein K6F86_05890 [Lachnospiraceae bacterium]|nr:hypothetical protein [Lachnospiraceae bacterium]
MADNSFDIENMIRNADFTKGSDHKNRLYNKLFKTARVTDISDELALDDLKNVRAAVKKDEGIDTTGKRK